MWGGIMRGYSSPASGSSPRGDAPNPEGVSKEASLKEASGYPKIKTEKFEKSLPRVVVIKDYNEDVGEVVIDEDVKDIRVKIKDVIVKILYDEFGLASILVDDVVVYKARER
jgi:hypothetical protein